MTHQTYTTDVLVVGGGTGEPQMLLHLPEWV
jgi:hypothetical protein